jgi:predicted ATP-dependent endonuclease of OLD family
MPLSSEIKEIEDKLASQGWPKFISNLSIKGLHGFSSIDVALPFPVTGIVGENGTGKSTILKLIACAYADREKRYTYYPSTFFPDTVWDKLKDIEINYQIKQGTRILVVGRGRPIRTEYMG